MKPDSRFLGLPSSFWACVRTIGQHVGYTVRGKGEILVPEVADLVRAMEENDLKSSSIADSGGTLTPLGTTLSAYFQYRAQLLNAYVEPRLMDAARAKREFKRLKRQLHGACPLPMNKQKGAKKAEAYLTGIVNMLIEANSEGLPCDYDPRRLTTVTRDGAAVAHAGETC